ncbi:unnamed protein product [Lasius platythorax]|uniref:type I protein arginine methyltransferase n=1 Tax=Lasius platythorax TaxID=488582 RepID=A0AAV2N713_9HYME
MDKYFEIYQKFDIHRLMLSDKRRVLIAYKNAIFNMKEKFQGKVVMDVGAGSGILSIFCAEVGVKKVYAVKASTLAKIIEQVSIENNLQNTIEVIHSKVEDIHPCNLEKIDIIVSLWMGFHLLHEGMLDSVLFARDNFLRRGGMMFPCEAILYASPCQLPSMYEFGVNSRESLPVYLSMRCIGKEYRKIILNEPKVLRLHQDTLSTEGKLLVWLDLNCISVEEVNLFDRKEFSLAFEKDEKYQGMCIWFAVEFPDGSKLSTAPYDEATHWKQTVFVPLKDIEVKRNDVINFKFKLIKDALNPRRYNIEALQYSVKYISGITSYNTSGITSYNSSDNTRFVFIYY